MIIAIDIGGTKTIVASVDEDGTILSEERFKTSHDTDQFTSDLQHSLGAIKGTPTVISVASAGLIDSQNGVIVYSPNLSWRNFALRSLLQKTYSCPIYLQNDASIAGLASVRALKNVPDLALYITVGTGIGTGVIWHGQLDTALARTEGGHMVFETKDGLRTWESFASGRAITEEFGQLAVDITDPKIWETIAEHLAIGLRVLIPMLRPDVIIFGGGVGTRFEQCEAPLTKLLSEQLPDFVALPALVRANDPEKAVIHGCYYYAVDKGHIPSPPSAAH